MSTNIFDATPVREKSAVKGAADDAVRHRASVRLAHWVMAAGVLGLMESGIGILISHPRLYWGETGAVGGPSLVDLPLPFIIGPSVWNRPIHFFFAWLLVIGALCYVIAGFGTKHFRKNVWPSKGEVTRANIWNVISLHLRWKRTAYEDASTYNVVQRLTYIAVVFAFFPGAWWTGLAMSPAVTSVLPWMATMFGGHQSVRTLHFVFASLLLAFLLVHIAMLLLVGFSAHVWAMITGYTPKGRAAQ
jgi:thiosulfate reductase cytochrome b subunit